MRVFRCLDLAICYLRVSKRQSEKKDLSVYLWEDLRQVQLEFLRHLFLVTSLRSFSTRK